MPEEEHFAEEQLEKHLEEEHVEEEDPLAEKNLDIAQKKHLQEVSG